MYNIFTPISGCTSVDCAFNIIKQFNQYGITYNEADEIIYLLSEQLKFQREHISDEVNNVDDLVVRCEIKTTSDEYK